MAGIYSREIKSSTFNGKITLHTGLFIDGEFVDAIDKGTIDVYDPTDGSMITQVSEASAKDVDIAVKAAARAFKNDWGLKVPGKERRRLLNKLADILEQHIDEISAIEAIDCGKTWTLAKMLDVQMSLDLLRYFAGWADKGQGKTMEVDQAKFAFTKREPIGVCALISPWNFPLMIAMSKIAPALATGNAVVIKPSEVTPLSMLKFAEFVKEAGFPPGVFNVTVGYGRTAGQALAEHRTVRKISVTGSTITGRKIMEAASKTNLKRVTLELGGKSPCIVFDDAPLEHAVQLITRSIFFHSGQICTASSRIYVQEGVYDKFLELLKAASKAGKAGGAFDPQTSRAPLVSEVQFARVMNYIQSGKDAGATVFSGGERDGNSGYYIQPTIFTNVKPDMKIVLEEIFGPVAVVMKFKTEEEAIDLANDTEYGLASCVYTKDVSRALRIVSLLDSGGVWINSPATSHVHVPFGGIKLSGQGQELGDEAIATYTTLKSVQVNLDF